MEPKTEIDVMQHIYQQMAEQIDNEVYNMVAIKMGVAAPKLGYSYFNNGCNMKNPCAEQELDSGETYIPKISYASRKFLNEMVSGMGEDEARRLLLHLNDVIVDKKFSISEYIDSTIVEFNVTRE